MTYAELREKLLAEGFERVERDDRLLDVFPDDTREKGIELWVKWGEEVIQIARVRRDVPPAWPKFFVMPTEDLTTLLLSHT